MKPKFNRSVFFCRTLLAFALDSLEVLSAQAKLMCSSSQNYCLSQLKIKGESKCTLFS